ncbi:Protein-L-isoaspartate(D-aspartate) O-methyltransferase [Saliniradius amylolyticus]|uniref:Protein-L-isoaspartate O-methyltransferase n=1 Tax=Saliniradius amylolyticus TaxID=2183582 RepID=A0A2S2E044_9ALTE|nr:protein-L-isoaspartate(D-aspartate) O-methyltransferase [Saliniradius amylolyticus]AWL11025.1 Protein-L-isoaspartate(D-aspartate) O-methyltransferase [Saliniradius amylolyticus]
MIQDHLNPTRQGEGLARTLYQEGIHNQNVLRAIACVPRDRFLPDTLKHKAYENTALPIGQGQTISQPYIVARMTELLLNGGHHCGKVLEIGTGCGYQSAVLAQLVDQVYSVERIKALQYQAKQRLHSMDLHNIAMKHGDGWQGWRSKGPFDGILVTAAASHMPEQLLHQLTDGGRLVIPVGEQQQHLYVISRNGDQFEQQVVEAVRFVPLVPGDIL